MNHNSVFDRFRSTLLCSDPARELRAGLIGKGAQIDGPYGPKPMLYADYVASGRALRQIEEFVMAEFLPWYANSHTETSFTGAIMTRLRREAKAVIRNLCGAGTDHAVIFAGSGATAGLNRLVHLLGVDADQQTGNPPVVLTGPYEHHSNILPWRESGAEVGEIPEAPCGGPDPDALHAALARHKGRRVIGAFSAASNVSGIVTDVVAVTRILKQAGALAVWDYAGGGPYLPINMQPAPDALIDAIALSPHKFVGGPQTSGLLLIRHDAVRATTPTFPGGGTVRFVSPEGHDYLADVEAREEAGTPNIIGDLRAALVLIVKDVLGQDFIDRQNARFRDRALKHWADDPCIQVLGKTECPRLPIFSFLVRDEAGNLIPPQLFTRLLSEHEGIQARGGCACAGPYGHHLLQIDPSLSALLRERILAGDEESKPGFVRLNFSYLFTDDDVTRVLTAVSRLARAVPRLMAERAA